MPHSTPSTENNELLTLTKEDVDKLLSSKTAEEATLDITHTLSSRYVQINPSGLQADKAEQIFRILARDAAVNIRTALSDHLKASAILPRDVALTMAKDVDAVALPMLQHSEVFTEEDLIQLVQDTEEASRHVAVSHRRLVPQKLTETLLTTNTKEVGHIIASNTGAILSDKAKEVLHARAEEDAAIFEVLRKRDGSLNKEEAQKVLNEYVNKVEPQNSDSPSGELQLTPITTSSYSKYSLIRKDPEKLITQLLSQGRLTPACIFTELAKGHIEFFELSLARLAGIPIQNAQKLIYDKGNLGLRALYNKSNMPDNLFGALKQLLTEVEQLKKHSKIKPGDEYAHAVLVRLQESISIHPDKQLEHLLSVVRHALSAQ